MSRRASIPIVRSIVKLLVFSFPIPVGIIRYPKEIHRSSFSTLLRAGCCTVTGLVPRVLLMDIYGIIHLNMDCQHFFHCLLKIYQFILNPMIFLSFFLSSIVLGRTKSSRVRTTSSKEELLIILFTALIRAFSYIFLINLPLP